MWKDKVNIGIYTSIPSEGIPLNFDPNYIYKGDHYIPGMGAWRHSEIKDAGQELIRNHYSIWFDPEGNQLPYLDGMRSFKMESRDVVVFRAMRGEQDNDRDHTALAELPLYMANMNKGDYSLFTYRDPSGMDIGIVVNQEYIEDPYIGSLMRTRDFRIALSVGVERDVINSLQLSGLGTGHNWVPHPSIPYYPGPEYETIDARLDVAKGQQILDKLGIVDTDGDGIRNRADGKGNLEIFFQAAPATGASFFGVVEILQAQWLENLQITLNIKSGSAGAAVQKGEQYFDMRGMMYQANPWAVAWTNLVPLVPGSNSPEVGRYYDTKGEQGMAPSGPDPVYADAYGSMAPEGTYPVDISGNQMKMQEIWTEGMAYSQWDPRRIEIAQEIFKINVQEKYVIPLMGFTGWSRGLRFVRNNYRNVTRDVKYQATETHYFEAGIDNTNHPGNKSKLYRSRTFLDATYWD